MKNFVIEYSTNFEDRQTVEVRALSNTDAYLRFMIAFPKQYKITDIKEIDEMKKIRLSRVNGQHIVFDDGKKRIFNTFLEALKYIKLVQA
mgnify:CR=1 FL=1